VNAISADDGTEVFDLPHVFRPKQFRRTLTAALGAAAVTLAVVPAAEAACTATPTTKAFAAFGDNADYSLAPAGAFESGATGWSLSGSSVANGNESAKVHGAGDGKSLAISATGQAVSPAFCVGIQNPSFRFFARRTSGTWGVLNVKLRVKGANGVTNETTVGSVSAADTAWHPSASIALSTVLGLWNGDQSASVQIVLDPEDYGGSWTVDDVYIDPYSRA
jgi:hypothetical protein